MFLTELDIRIINRPLPQKYRGNHSLNFCIIYELYNADITQRSELWSDDKL